MPYATAIQSLRAYEHTYHQLCGSRQNHHPPHLEYLVGTHCSTHILGRLLHVEHRLASKDIKTTYYNNNCWHTQCILVTIDINTKKLPSTTPQEPYSKYYTAAAPLGSTPHSRAMTTHTKTLNMSARRSIMRHTYTFTHDSFQFTRLPISLLSLSMSSCK